MLSRIVLTKALELRSGPCHGSLTRRSLQKHLRSINCENQEDHLRRMYQMSTTSFLKPSAKTSSATNLRRTRSTERHLLTGEHQFTPQVSGKPTKLLLCLLWNKTNPTLLAHSNTLSPIMGGEEEGPKQPSLVKPNTVSLSPHLPISYPFLP